ncbi:hypothetical protein FQP85_22165 [Pseudoalteromonas neustonica]|uniref:Uncharacterized protein n=1 Tax=Pseudoalteromonas neustonica TaxID=1840331 RepID=A0ABY3F869_9GAMM|nr:hypothetical protein [Pseudoalteromonas neustonica]TVU79899.1 hypothetical protein FQP85_22165 [Pseudoalteromonas neustonica]
MNNQRIKALAIQHGFKLEEQKTGEMDLNQYVYSFAWALLQDGKPKLSHRQYLADLLKDAAAILPLPKAFTITIKVNEVNTNEPLMNWYFHDGVKQGAHYQRHIPDSREELNLFFRTAEGHMKGMSYRALNPDYDKKLA